jgi:N-acetylneuraminic acid mutarotase
MKTATAFIFTASLLLVTSCFSQVTWSQKANFGGTRRDCAVGFSIGTKGYIGTGVQNDAASFTKDFWEYDPMSDFWTQKADFPGVARQYAIGFSIGSKDIRPVLHPPVKHL